MGFAGPSTAVCAEKRVASAYNFMIKNNDLYIFPGEETRALSEKFSQPSGFLKRSAQICWGSAETAGRSTAHSGNVISTAMPISVSALATPARSPISP